MAFTASDNSQPSARVELKKLSRCVSVTLGPSKRIENVVLLEATLLVSLPIERCGCASAGLRYVSFLRYPDGERDVLGQGRLETAERIRSRAAIMLVAASDADPGTELGKLFIEMSCEVPRIATQRRVQ
ncbi:MAG TPA: DUF2195 family protein [Polyangiales bacterium]|nr:DUF2195 family protein [Polyangiales bacterium]